MNCFQFDHKLFIMPSIIGQYMFNMCAVQCAFRLRHYSHEKKFYLHESLSLVRLLHYIFQLKSLIFSVRFSAFRRKQLSNLCHFASFFSISLSLARFACMIRTRVGQRQNRVLFCCCYYEFPFQVLKHVRNNLDNEMCARVWLKPQTHLLFMEKFDILSSFLSIIQFILRFVVFLSIFFFVKSLIVWFFFSL